MCSECAETVHYVDNVHLHDQPAENPSSSPYSNSIANSILSLQFLSLGTFPALIRWGILMRTLMR